MPISQNEAIEEKEFYDERLAIHLRDGRELFTRRVSVTDSTLTIYSLTNGGKKVVLEPPMVVNWSEVESMERMKFDDAKTIGALLFVSLGIVGIWWVGKHLPDGEFHPD